MLARLGLALLLTLPFAACESAESFCDGIYDNGRTPGWAQGQFSDRESCVDWYEDLRSQT